MPETKLTEDEFQVPPIMPEVADTITSEHSVDSATSERTASKAIEQGAPTPLPGSMSAPQNAASLPLPNQMAPPVALSGNSAAALPAVDDGDLIEKEWVEKAKQIVERTKGDPYAQSKEISQVKIEYLKKRYNKDFEVTS